MIYDTIIIGGGPAGIAAGVYAARKKLNTLFITYDFGGQSIVSPDIQNWIGTTNISGEDLAKQLENHLRQYEGQGLTILTKVKARNLQKTNELFTVTTDNNQDHQAKTILITSGSHRRRLDIPGAAEFDQKGLTYCASCDGPLFTDQDTIVIGGGNAGFETAAQLLAYTKSVTLLHRNAEFKADKITVDKLLANPKFTAITNAEPTEVIGEKFVTGLNYKDKNTGEQKYLPASGIFVEIGFNANTDFAKDLVATDEFGAVKVNATNQQTSQPGIWAAGDCTNALYHQNNIAAGDAIKAIEDIYTHLHIK